MIIPEKHDQLLRASKANDAQAANEGKQLPAAGSRSSTESRPAAAVIAGDARASLSGEHVAEIRQRIRDGAYNTVEIADQVAQRLLNSGDLELEDE